jgi:hypothetical protein
VRAESHDIRTDTPEVSVKNTRTRVFLAAVTAAAAFGVVAPASAGATPSCSVTWGSQPKAVNATSPGDDLVADVRAGRHDCYDRVVIEVADVSGFDAWDVRYVPSVRQDGSGAVVPLRGAADLQVTLGARAYDENGHATYSPARRTEAVDVTGFTTLRQVAWLGSSEGRSSVGIGTRAQLPFRVFLIEGSSAGIDRLVIDVAHHW